MTETSDGGNEAVEPVAGEEMWHFDLEKALEFVEDDEDLLRAVVEVFIEESPRLVQDVEDGLREGDQAKLRHAAHTLRANFNTLCLEQMRQLSQSIETLASAGRLAETTQQVKTLRLQTDAIITQLSDYLAG